MAQGFIIEGRVNGILALSRALGDFALKQAAVTGQVHKSYHPVKGPVSSMPEVHTIDYTPRKIKWVVLGSDGIWDVMEDEDAVKILDDCELRGEVNYAKCLVYEAYGRRSSDNMTAIVIRLYER